MVYEGTRHQGTYINGKWRDLRVYSVISTEPGLGIEASDGGVESA